jgi:hypothetical protein
MASWVLLPEGYAQSRQGDLDELGLRISRTKRANGYLSIQQYCINSDPNAMLEY